MNEDLQSGFDFSRIWGRLVSSDVEPSLGYRSDRICLEHQRCGSISAQGNALGRSHFHSSPVGAEQRGAKVGRPFRAGTLHRGIPRALPWTGISPGLWPSRRHAFGVLFHAHCLSPAVAESMAVEGSIGHSSLVIRHSAASLTVLAKQLPFTPP